MATISVIINLISGRVHVMTDGFSTSISVGAAEGPMFPNQPADPDEEDGEENVDVSQMRCGLVFMEKTTNLLQRIMAGGGEVVGADPGVISVVTTEKSNSNLAPCATVRAAEKSANHTGGKKISNGLYQKMLLTDVRTNSFRRERKRRVDNGMNLEEIFNHLSHNKAKSTKEHIERYRHLTSRLFAHLNFGPQHSPILVHYINHVRRPFYRKWKGR